MEQIIEMLTPWAKPVMVFCGFMLVRYIYRTVIGDTALFNAFKQQNVV